MRPEGPAIPRPAIQSSGSRGVPLRQRGVAGAHPEGDPTNASTSSMHTVYRVDVNNGHKPTERLFTLKKEGGELTTEWAGMRPAGTDESGSFFAPAR